MQKSLAELKKEYDKLQVKYGSPDLRSIYFGGQLSEPKLFLVFMNPTKGNVASSKSWKGERYPWIGTKNIWKLFYKAGLFSEDLFREIQSRKPRDWNEGFAEEVYKEIKQRDIFITNLAKCTQEDARPLPNSLFKTYVKFLQEEIKTTSPKIIITFGNQVSSIVLGRKIEVSKCRKVKYKLDVNGREFSVYPVFYPVGNGMRNIDKSAEDINYIISNI